MSARLVGMSSIIEPTEFISSILVGNASIVKEGDNERQAVADLERLKSLNVVHCPVCQKTFIGTVWLQFHLQDKHSNTEVYCDTCPYEVFSATDFVMHLEDEHNGSNLAYMEEIIANKGKRKQEKKAIKAAKNRSAKKEKLDELRKHKKLKNISYKHLVTQYCATHQEIILRRSDLIAHKSTHKKSELSCEFLKLRAEAASAEGFNLAISQETSFLKHMKRCNPAINADVNFGRTEIRGSSPLAPASAKKESGDSLSIPAVQAETANNQPSNTFPPYQYQFYNQHYPGLQTPYSSVRSDSSLTIQSVQGGWNTATSDYYSAASSPAVSSPGANQASSSRGCSTTGQGLVNKQNYLAPQDCVFYIEAGNGYPLKKEDNLQLQPPGKYFLGAGSGMAN